jgi:hypothetical protein
MDGTLLDDLDGGLLEPIKYWINVGVLPAEPPTIPSAALIVVFAKPVEVTTPKYRFIQYRIVSILHRNPA